MKVESIAECSPWSILQYFWPALSNNRSLEKQFLVFFWSGRSGQVVLYAYKRMCVYYVKYGTLKPSFLQTSYFMLISPSEFGRIFGGPGTWF